MPFIIVSKDGKRAGMNILLTAHEIGRLRDDAHCYKIVNTTTHRVSSVGAACRKPTPEHLWGSKRRRNRKSSLAGAGGFLAKLFGKKKAKRHPMSKRIYWVPSPGGGRGHTKHGYAMGRARRRRR